MESDSAAPPECSEPSAQLPFNVAEKSKRCVMSPARLEFLCNVLMLPDVTLQYGLVLKKPTCNSNKDPNEITNARKRLASLLNEKDHPGMAGTSIGHEGISNWILQIRSDVSSYAEWLKGSAARGKGNGPTLPSHHKAAFDLLEVLDKFQRPSQHNQKPANARAAAEPIKWCDKKKIMMNSLASVRRLLRVQARRRLPCACWLSLSRCAEAGVRAESPPPRPRPSLPPLPPY